MTSLLSGTYIYDTSQELYSDIFHKKNLKVFVHLKISVYIHLHQHYVKQLKEKKTKFKCLLTSEWIRKF